MKCPICKKDVAVPAGEAAAPSYFPFCSERCKLVDLGRWLDGQYQIPVKNDDPDALNELAPDDRPDD